MLLSSVPCARTDQRPARAAVQTMRSLGRALTLLVVTAQLGCVEPPSRPLRVGVVLWPAYELFFLAEAEGFYEGADLALVSFRSPAEAVRAYRSGLLDAAPLTLEYALHLEAEDPGHSVILVLDESIGGDAVIAQPGFRQASDLRGHRVAVEASALGAYFLRRFLELSELDAESVELVSADYAHQEELFRSGGADAVITFEPVRSRLLALGGNEVFSSLQVPGEILDVLVAPDRILEERPEPLLSLVAGWFRAREVLGARPLEAARVMAPREGLSAEEFLLALEGARLLGLEENLRLLASPDPELASAVRRLSDRLVAYGMVTATVPPEDLLRDDVIQRVTP